MTKNIMSVLILGLLAYLMGPANAQGNETPLSIVSKCPIVVIQQHSVESSLEGCRSFGPNKENLLVIKKNKEEGISIAVYKTLKGEVLDLDSPLMQESGLGLEISNFNQGRFHFEDIDGDGNHELLIRSSNRSYEHFYSFTLDLDQRKFVDIGGEYRYDGNQLLEGHQLNLAPNSYVYYENKRLMIRTPGEEKKVYKFKEGRFQERKRPNNKMGLDLNY